MRIFFFVFLSCCCWGSASLSSLYYGLDPLSITQNLTFYELYPDSQEGGMALQRARTLLYGEQPFSSFLPSLPKLDLQAIISLITRQPSDPMESLTESQLALMEKIGSTLCNKKLQGAHIWTEAEALSLPEEEFDLGRALLLCQFGDKPSSRKEILQYEASLDLMAIQIRVRLPKDPSAEDKIKEINRFIFQEMGFRYPPLSIYAKDIDFYSFLPSVLDSRRGICLGVSVLYLCLAQRLGLDLEIITPPGHIYVRYPSPNGELNIETTARGIDLPSENYLGINTRYLQKRTIKEVVGASLFNLAGLLSNKGEYKQAVEAYEHALLYVKEDPLFKMLLGINCLFAGDLKKGKKILTSLSPLCFDYAVSEETMIEDYLEGKTDVAGLQAIFQPVDETRNSIVEKQNLLLATLKKYPKFREGLFQLAVTHLQLGRMQEALTILLQYHSLDQNNVTVEYYLSLLCQERLDYPKAWEFFKQAQALATRRNHSPKALKELLLSIRQSCPAP